MALPIRQPARPASGYRLVRLRNGVYSIRSLAHHETFHPAIGPVAEAEALYVEQLRLVDRRCAEPGEFVVWDVGLGAAGNAVTVLRATRHIPGVVRLLSFDQTLEPLRFALDHAEALGYFNGYVEPLRALIESLDLEFWTRSGTMNQVRSSAFRRRFRAEGRLGPRPRERGTPSDRFTERRRVRFTDERQQVDWTLHLGDFPTWLAGRRRRQPAGHPSPAAPPAPHAILFDAYSPATNPAMWTQPLFANLAGQLDPARPCALPTYSRSTMLRVTLLLAGFMVGAGQATGEKEETTIAANDLRLIDRPLDRRWLRRARRSTSAEPLWEPVYRQRPLSPATWERLLAHPLFA